MGNPAWALEDETGTQAGPDLLYPGARQPALASICTDLWAYSIADFDLWVARGGDASLVVKGFVDRVVVPPGVYEFTHHTGEKDFDGNSEAATTYAHVRWVGPA